MYIDGIRTLVEAVIHSNRVEKNDDLKLIYDAILLCAEYVARVTSTESARMIDKYLYDIIEYQERYELLEKSRTATHNATMINLKIINRLCIVYDTALIFSEVELALPRADFADNLIFPIVEELFEHRVK